MPSHWKRESLETVKEQLICHGAQIREKDGKIWSIRINENYQYKQEAIDIYRSIKKRAYFKHYVKILNNNKLL